MRDSVEVASVTVEVVEVADGTVDIVEVLGARGPSGPSGLDAQRSVFVGPIAPVDAATPFVWVQTDPGDGSPLSLWAGS